MFVMCLLRICADLGFYYAFAATASMAFGGRFHLPAVAVLGLCYAVCFRLRGRRRGQYQVLGAAALALLLPVPWADRAAYLPALAYVVHLVRRDNFDLSRSRQAELLDLFGRIFTIFSFLWCAVRFIAAPTDDIRLLLPIATREWLAAGVPAALLGAGASVLLMRSARHEPAVYLQPGFQAVNAAAAVLTALAAAAVSSPWAVGAMAWAYWNVLLPVLLVFFMAVGLVMVLTYPVIKLLADFFSSGDTREAVEELIARLDEFFEVFHKLGFPPAEVIFRVCAAVITVLSLLLAAIVTRFAAGWLLERWRERTGSRIPVQQARRLLPVPEALQRQQERRTGSSVERVRRQYQTFLRLCRKRGVDFSRASTSGDISEAASRVFGPEAPVGDIRDIYRAARYLGAAGRGDVSRMRKLCSEVRKLRPRT